MKHQLGFTLAGLLLALATALLPVHAVAEIGIAVSQAPEAGTGVCFGDGADATMSCARKKCMAESGLGAADCPRVLWCFPAGWSADIFMQHREGFHWHDYLCGWDSREKLQSAVALKCKNDFLIECSAVQIWSPEGKAQSIEQ